jgi:hypothetical protein
MYRGTLESIAWQMRHFCDAVHERGAWIVCSAASTATFSCVYIAAQQEENP